MSEPVGPKPASEHTRALNESAAVMSFDDPGDLDRLHWMGGDAEWIGGSQPDAGVTVVDGKDGVGEGQGLVDRDTVQSCRTPRWKRSGKIS